MLLRLHDREAMLRHAVEADKEFCLSCELGFLFRMLFAAKGQACQVRPGPCAALQAINAGLPYVLNGCTDSPENAGRQRLDRVSPPAQASNLLRALRQNREAGALGLLEVWLLPSSHPRTRSSIGTDFCLN